VLQEAACSIRLRQVGVTSVCLSSVCLASIICAQWLCVYCFYVTPQSAFVVVHTTLYNHIIIIIINMNIINIIINIVMHNN